MTAGLASMRSAEFDFPDILFHGLRSYIRLFPKILLIILCVNLPIHLMWAWLLASVPLGTGDSQARQSVVQSLFHVLNVLDVLAGSIAILALTFLVEQSLLKQEASWWAALRHGVSRWPSTFVTGLVYICIVFGLALLFIIPGIIWMVYYTFWVYVVAVRNLNFKDALDYSKRLVKGREWEVFFIQLGLGLLVILPIIWLMQYASSATTDPLTLFAITLASDLILALPVTMQIVWFLNLDAPRLYARQRGARRQARIAPQPRRKPLRRREREDESEAEVAPQPRRGLPYAPPRQVSIRAWIPAASLHGKDLSRRAPSRYHHLGSR